MKTSLHTVTQYMAQPIITIYFSLVQAGIPKNQGLDKSHSRFLGSRHLQCYCQQIIDIYNISGGLWFWPVAPATVVYVGRGQSESYVSYPTT